MNYEITIRSRPGFYEQYEKTLRIFADDEAQAEDRAYREMRLDFPDRGRSMWKTVSIKCLGACRSR